jgi:predicted phage-related endonuclease
MLSPEQILARQGKLTASRISALMTGDAKKIYNLWLEMTGQEFETEDVSRVWPVQLGSCTESLNLYWYELKNAAVVTRRGEVVEHYEYDWAACTLDGWIVDLNCPIECKHVGGREPLEVIIERYQPQMHWQMEVTSARMCALSVIFGASEPVVEFIEFDDAYAAEMVSRGAQFMQHVARKTPPVILDAVAAPIDASKVYEMHSNNSWAMAANEWLSTKDAAATNRSAEKILKSLVPEDAKKCIGHSIQITRDRAGRLSLRESHERT